MKNVIFTFVAVALLFGFTTNAKADYQSYSFVITGSVQTDWSKVNSTNAADWCQIVVSYNEGLNAADFAFNVNAEYAKTAFVGGGLKLTANGNVGLYLDIKDTVANVFSSNFSGSAFGGNSIITPNSPITASLTFKTGYSWEDFEALIVNGDISIIGHIQSLNSNVAGVQSINGAKFTLDTRSSENTGSTSVEETPTNATPEPATLLILGLGFAGAGFVARSRMSK